MNYSLISRVYGSSFVSYARLNCDLRLLFSLNKRILEKIFSQLRNLRLAGLLVVILMLNSCIERIETSQNDNSPQIYLVSEISPDSPIYVDLRTTATLNDQGDHKPQEAAVFLTGTGLNDSEVGFQFISSLDRFVLRNSNFRPEAGGSYKIRAEVPDTDIVEVTSETRVPHPTQIDQGVITNSTIVDEGATEDHIYNVTLKLGNPTEVPGYYHIIPSYEILQKRGGEFTSSGIFENFQILDVGQGSNASKRLFHTSGILVQYSKMEGNEIELMISTESKLEKDLESIDQLDFKLITVTEDYYDYHATLSDQVESQGSVFNTPVQTKSNIENGWGLFSGMSSSQLSVPIEE